MAFFTSANMDVPIIPSEKGPSRKNSNCIENTNSSVQCTPHLHQSPMAALEPASNGQAVPALGSPSLSVPAAPSRPPAYDAYAATAFARSHPVPNAPLPTKSDIRLRTELPSQLDKDFLQPGLPLNLANDLSVVLETQSEAVDSLASDISKRMDTNSPFVHKPSCAQSFATADNQKRVDSFVVKSTLKKRVDPLVAESTHRKRINTLVESTQNSNEPSCVMRLEQRAKTEAVKGNTLNAFLNDDRVGEEV